MWKIENHTNRIYLEKFESEIIIPVFEMMLETSGQIKDGTIVLPLQKKDIWEKTGVFTKASSDRKKLFSYLMEKTVVGRKLEDIIHTILINNNLKYIRSMYDLYKEQNQEVSVGNYSIDQVLINDYFKDIFIDFYYNKFFNDDYLWHVIAGDRYDRSIFHRNFQAENELSVCPYCDIDTIISVSNMSIEHFLPKSKYPFLAMNSLNLISSCSACNKAHEGKGEKVSSPPIVTPYNEMIGESIEFRVDFTKNILTLHNKGGVAQDNYLSLLKLHSRYEDPYIFTRVDKKAESLFETLSNYTSASRKEVYSYISLREKEESLSLALKSVISTYSQFKRY